VGKKMMGSLKKQGLKLSKESNVSDIVDEFMRYSGIRGLSSFTLKNYRNTLRKFFAEYIGVLNDPVALRRHILVLLAGSGDEYHNKRLSVYRLFFDFCVERGLLEKNPAVGLKFRRHTVRVVDHADETIQKLLRIINKDTFSGLRDYAFAILILDTGIRPSEALQVTPDDIDFVRKRIHVRPEVSKTREERFLPISVQVIHILEKLMHIRPDEWSADTPVLSTYEGGEMPTAAIRDRFRQYSLRTGTSVTPYHLRHTFAVNFIRNGGDPFTLQYLMGHKKMEMTRVYVHLNEKDIADKHAAASPLRNYTGGKRVVNVKKK